MNSVTLTFPPLSLISLKSIRLLHVSIVYSFLLLTSVPWYGHSRVCSSLKSRGFMNIHVQVLVWLYQFSFLRIKSPRVQGPGCVLSARLLSWETDRHIFQSDSTIFHSHQWWMRITVSTCPSILVLSMFQIQEKYSLTVLLRARLETAVSLLPYCTAKRSH